MTPALSKSNRYSFIYLSFQTEFMIDWFLWLIEISQEFHSRHLHLTCNLSLVSKQNVRNICQIMRLWDNKSMACFVLNLVSTSCVGHFSRRLEQICLDISKNIWSWRHRAIHGFRDYPQIVCYFCVLKFMRWCMRQSDFYLSFLKYYHELCFYKHVLPT